jgi:hypothetical protein
MKSFALTVAIVALALNSARAECWEPATANTPFSSADGITFPSDFGLARFERQPMCGQTELVDVFRASASNPAGYVCVLGKEAQQKYCQAEGQCCVPAVLNKDGSGETTAPAPEQDTSNGTFTFNNTRFQGTASVTDFKSSPSGTLGCKYQVDFGAGPYLIAAIGKNIFDADSDSCRKCVRFTKPDGSLVFANIVNHLGPGSSESVMQVSTVAMGVLAPGSTSVAVSYEITDCPIPTGTEASTNAEVPTDA